MKYSNHYIIALDHQSPYNYTYVCKVHQFHSSFAHTHEVSLIIMFWKKKKGKRKGMIEDSKGIIWDQNRGKNVKKNKRQRSGER